MEGSQSEAVFEAYDLQPQLFINEVLNIVDGLVDDAFDFCREHASAMVSADGDADRSQEVLRGISSLHGQARETLKKRLELWERYCLINCFSVPEGFSSAKDNNTSLDFLRDGILETELDNEILSLRQKLSAVGQECASCQREVNALEKQSSQHDVRHSSVSDVLRLLEESSVQNIFHEIGENAAKLQRELKSWPGEMAAPRKSGVDLRGSWPNKQDLFMKLEDLQKTADTLKLFKKP